MDSNLRSPPNQVVCDLLQLHSQPDLPVLRSSRKLEPQDPAIHHNRRSLRHGYWKLLQHCLDNKPNLHPRNILDPERSERQLRPEFRPTAHNVNIPQRRSRIGPSPFFSINAITNNVISNRPFPLATPVLGVVPVVEDFTLATGSLWRGDTLSVDAMLRGAGEIDILTCVHSRNPCFDRKRLRLEASLQAFPRKRGLFDQVLRSEIMGR